MDQPADAIAVSQPMLDVVEDAVTIHSRRAVHEMAVGAGGSTSNCPVPLRL
jgi:hypothetical protein